MAAVELASPLVVDLRQIKAEDLDVMLAEEVVEWEKRFDWDFRPSADLVRRFVRMQALQGYVLMAGRAVVGYCYYVAEDRKGLIGDIFVRAAYRSPETECRLIGAVLRSLWSAPYVDRVESQLIMLSGEAREALPYRLQLRLFPRNFMMASLSGIERLHPGPSQRRAIYQTWHERDTEQAARLIAATYKGHVDAEINDQYRSLAGARRFLQNIVHYPGCGTFFDHGSFVALDSVTGHLAGMALASQVAFDVGHITQICVDPAYQGLGIGYELMRRALLALRGQGCRAASLTVTTSNHTAVRLYERIGFSTRSTFDAFVWDAIR